MGDSHYSTVVGPDGKLKPRATGARELLEFKRSGVFKSRVVVQGFKEARELLDGADLDYASNVISLTAIRQMFMRLLEDGEVIAQVDVATAFLQSTPFGPDESPRYLVVRYLPSSLFPATWRRVRVLKCSEALGRYPVRLDSGARLDRGQQGSSSRVRSRRERKVGLSACLAKACSWLLCGQWLCLWPKGGSPLVY